MEDNIYFKILTKHLTNIVKRTCVKCGSDHLKFREAQVRASDEPTFVYITCMKCKHVEVESD